MPGGAEPCAVRVRAGIDYALGDQLRAGVQRRVEERAIERRATDDGERAVGERDGRRTVVLFEDGRANGEGMLTLVSSRAGKKARVRDQFQRARRDAAPARFLARMTPVDNRHARTVPGQTVRRPRAGRSGSRHGDVEIRHPAIWSFGDLVIW